MYGQNLIKKASEQRVRPERGAEDIDDVKGPNRSSSQLTGGMYIMYVCMYVCMYVKNVLTTSYSYYGFICIGKEVSSVSVQMRLMRLS
jgi:hypothetical protein